MVKRQIMPQSSLKIPFVSRVVQVLIFLSIGSYLHVYFMVDSQSSCNDRIKVPDLGSNIPSTTKTTPAIKSTQSYKPAAVEKYIMEHLDEFGWNVENNPVGCMIWNDPNHALYNDLQLLMKELDAYQNAVRNFTSIQGDLRELKRTAIVPSKVCEKVRLSNSLINGIFLGSGQLSLSSSGFIEPLTTPMRHPRFCSDQNKLMAMDYMVHDFEAMCEKLQPHSRTIFIDMGASLSYHDDQANINPLLAVDENPIEYVLNLYEKFGFHFDHIYGLEAKFSSPEDVYQKLLPEKYMASYHWINSGVQSDPTGRLNPLHSILRKYNEDDFVVIKLDIDTANIELSLARQLLEDESLSKMVDQFYFEHHVHMKEMARIWRSAMSGSLKDTFVLFFGLRERGGPAHFWV